MTLAAADVSRHEQRFGDLAARALPAVEIGTADSVVVRDIVCDSRQVRRGSCFVATAGTQADGHDFIREAVQAGAAVVVAERRVPIPLHSPLVIVPDSRAALSRLAASFYGLDTLQAKRRLHIAGITGTNGKTTVAWLLRSILRARDRACAMIGTIENDLLGRRFEASMTTPPAVDVVRYLAEAAAAGADYAVMEVSSHALDQRRCDGLYFDAAVFTNLSGEHLDYHKTTDDYLRAKKRLFDGLAPQASAVVNADEPAAERIVADCPARVVRFGLNAVADVSVVVHAVTAAGSRFELKTPVGQGEIRFPLVGRHNVANALAAAAAGLSLGADWGAVCSGLTKPDPVPGRMERVAGPDHSPTVLVDYAHTDDALANVLRAVRALEPRRVWVVFGCGGDRDQTKRPRMGRLAIDLADEIIITLDNPRTEPPDQINEQILEGIPAARRHRTHIEIDRCLAIQRAINLADPDDVVLLAGKGHETYQIFGTRRLPFDDRQVAAEALASRERLRRALVL